MRINKNRNNGNKKNNAGFLICIVLLILIATLCIIIAVVKLWENRMASSYEAVVGNSKEYARIEVDDTEYVWNPEIETILFLGLDTLDKLEPLDGYYQVLQSDFVGLLIADKSTKTYRILQINRDTMMDMSVLSAFGERMYSEGEELYTVYQQFTLAYNYGDGYELSAENTVFNLQLLLNNVPIDHYVIFGMSAIPVLNDLVGGVEVTVEDDLTEADPTLVQGETINLNGKQALAYVQSRMTVADGTNLNRIARQQDYLTKLYEKIMMSEDESVLLSAVDAVEDYMFTDTTANTLSRIAGDIEGFEYLGFVELEGTANYENTWAEYYVDEEAKMRTIIELFYEEAE